MYRLTLLAFLFFVCLQVNAQQDDLALLDSVTYAQYYTGQWQSLMDTADRAIKNKQPFYWLYVRAAYAAQQLNKPYLEYYYLSEAQRLYPQDALIASRLYASSFATGQYTNALKLNAALRHDSMLRPYYPRLPLVHLLNLETGYKSPSDQKLYDPLYYVQAGIGFRIKQVSLYSALSYMEQKMYYGHMKQYQLYASANFSVRNNWQLIPIIHIMAFHIGQAPAYIDQSKLTGQPFAVGVQVARQHKGFRYFTGVYYSELGRQQQVQIQPGVTWHPGSGNKYSISASANYLSEKSHISFSGSLGYSPWRNFSLSAGYLSAYARYYTEENGYLVNNSYDVTKDRYMLGASWKIGPLLSLYGMYQYETKTENYYDLAYVYHTGILGMKKLF